MGTTVMLTPPGLPGAGAPGGAVRHEVEVAAMGGRARLAVLGHEDCRGAALVALADHGLARLAELEARWSRFRPDSEISRLNLAHGGAQVLSPATYALVERAVAAWHLTDGRCDPTVLPALLQLGYDRTYEELAPAPPAGWPAAGWPPVAEGPLSHSPALGARAVELVPAIGAVRLAPGAAIDAGAIGRGFAADLVAAELVAAGARGVLVDVGGDVRVSGRGPADGAWLVDVPHPGATAEPLVRLAVGDGAVATSSTGRRWGRAGQTVHHVLDPRTGRPVDDGLASVTVLARDAWVAAALSTAALVAGPHRAAAFLAERHATALLVRADGTTEHVGPLGGFLA